MSRVPASERYERKDFRICLDAISLIEILGAIFKKEDYIPKKSRWLHSDLIIDAKNILKYALAADAIELKKDSFLAPRRLEFQMKAIECAAGVKASLETLKVMASGIPLKTIANALDKVSNIDNMLKNWMSSDRNRLEET